MFGWCRRSFFPLAAEVSSVVMSVPDGFVETSGVAVAGAVTLRPVHEVVAVVAGARQAHGVVRGTQGFTRRRRDVVR